MIEEYSTKYFQYNGLPCLLSYTKGVPVAAKLYFPGRGLVSVPLTEVIMDASPISKNEYDNLIINIAMTKPDN
jgi:hypothetical protein